MYKQIVFALFSFALVSSFEIVQDEEGQEYYLLPLHRARRASTNVDIQKSGGGGASVTLDHKGTIFENDNHRVDGGAFASKQFKPNGPPTVGGNLQYTHIPSSSSLNLGASHTKHLGTDFSTSGTANLWQKGNSRLDAVGSYSRHFNGPFGTGRPDYYGGLQFTHRF
uniref:Attacin 2 n=1 Tax=Anatolica polita TaxID=442710 RepID=A0A1P8NW77_9CUCU|nr:attacin 2 [Anatolica polita]